MSRIPATKRIPFFGTALSVLFILILSPLRPAFAKTAASADSARFSVQTVRPRLVRITGENGNKGFNGFIAEMGDGTYLVTSQRVLLGSKRLSFKTLSGKALHPRGVELSASRDLARLALGEKRSGLEISDETSMGASVFLLEKSPISTEPPLRKGGRIIGVGADRVEISIPFSPGASGTPLLNAEGRVIALAGQIQEPYMNRFNRGTRFGSAPRYFCHRLAKTQWRPVDWKRYNHEFGEFHRESTTFAKAVESIISALEEDPTQSIRCGKETGTLLESWISSHNRLAGKQGKTTKTRLLAIENAQNIKQLAGICRNKSQKLQLFSEQRGLTGFLSDDFAAMACELDNASQYLNILGDNARDR